MIKIRLTIMMLMLVFCAVGTMAQGSPTGAMTGVTKDDAGASVPGSRVVATNNRHKRDF